MSKKPSKKISELLKYCLLLESDAENRQKKRSNLKYRRKEILHFFAQGFEKEEEI